MKNGRDEAQRKLGLGLENGLQQSRTVLRHPSLRAMPLKNPVQQQQTPQSTSTTTAAAASTIISCSWTKSVAAFVSDAIVSFFEGIDKCKEANEERVISKE